MHRKSLIGPVLVTGGSGFVGHCAARRLLREGYDVHLVLRPGASSWRLDTLPSDAQIHSADLLDAEAVRRLLLELRPQVVLHFAAYGAYERQSEGQRVLLTNVLGSYHLLEAAAEARVSLFVNAGTSSEYGLCSVPMREDLRLEPNSLYAVGKAAGTHLCSWHGRQNAGMSTVSFRLFSVYGPWEEPSRLMPTALRRAQAGLPLAMVAPDIAHDFIYVEDALDLMLAFERLSGIRGEVFNLGSGVQSTLEDVVAAVEQVIGRRATVCWGAMARRQWDTNCWQADITMARRRFEWRPRRNLVQGLAAMAAWMTEVGYDYGPK
jgi:nucleoside-diphosphate-sugar epimerase